MMDAEAGRSLVLAGQQTVHSQVTCLSSFNAFQACKYRPGLPCAGPSANGAGSSPPANRGGSHIQEYYVKLKGQAYLHCRWLPRDLILNVGQRVHRGLLKRLTNFDNKRAPEAEVSHSSRSDKCAGKRVYIADCLLMSWLMPHLTASL